MEDFPELLEKLREARRMNKRDLAQKARLTPGYVSHLTRGARNAPSKGTIDALATALQLNTVEKAQLLHSAGYIEEDGSNGIPNESEKQPTRSKRVHLPEIRDTTTFYGRKQELEVLERWIVADKRQLVTVWGLGGIGKTTFALKLAHEIEPSFDALYWTSLQDVPPVENFIEDCIRFYTDQNLSVIPQDEERLPILLDQLLGIFQSQRCLLIIDNFESVLREGENTGEYRERYAGYGTLLRKIGEVQHKSCLLLTSREKPREVVHMQNNAALVKSYLLTGITHEELREILKDKDIYGSEADWKDLNKMYSGNPLALKLAAGQINELFEGVIGAFLKENSVVFSGISDLLEQHFKRLSPLEGDIMYWLAINLEQTSLNDLRNDLINPVSRSTLLDALDSLKRRSMIETFYSGYFGLQPAILEYVIKVFVERVCQELKTQHYVLFEHHALIKAQAKDYLRERQTRLILDPVAKFLVSRFGQEGSKKYLKEAIHELQRHGSQAPAYSGGNILNILAYLRVDLTKYDFSELTLWQAFLQSTELRDVNFSGSDLSKSAFTETFGNIYCVSISAGGKWMAAGTANNEIRLWEDYGSVPIRTLYGHIDYVRAVSFSPIGELLASASQDKTIRLWDIGTGQCINKLEGHSDWVWAITFSPDGQQLASSGDDWVIRVWDINTAQCVKTFREHGGWIRTVRFSPDGRLLASGSDDQTVHVRDMQTGHLQMLSGHTGWIRGLTFNQDSSLLASCSDDRTIRLWDVNTGKCLSVFRGHTGRVRSVAFSHDGQWIVSGSDDQTIRHWSVPNAQFLKVLYGHSGWVRSVTFSHDDKTIVSGSEDQTIRHWDVSTGQCLKVLQGHRSELYSLSFDRSGTMLVSGGEDQTVRLWNVDEKRSVKAMVGHTARIRAVAFSPDRRLVASASEDQTLRLWDIQSGLCLQTLQDPDSGRMLAVTFSPDGLLLASGHEDHKIRLWEVSTGQLLASLEGHVEWVWSLSFHPDGQTLASSGDENMIRLWNVVTGECLKVLDGHSHRVRAVTFSLDGKLLASGSDDQEARLWDVSSGRCLQVLKGHKNRVRSVAFSPDGLLLASSGEDEAIILWDVQTGEQIKRFGESNSVRVISFSPDGKQLASDSADSTIKLWDIPSGRNAGVLKSDRPYERMNINGVKGLSEAQRGMLRSLGAIGIPSS